MLARFFLICEKKKDFCIKLCQVTQLGEGLFREKLAIFPDGVITYLNYRNFFICVAPHEGVV